MAIKPAVHLYSISFARRLVFFPPIQVEKSGASFTSGSKVRYHRFSIPPTAALRSSYRFRVSFQLLKRDPNVSRPFDRAVTLTRGSKLESAHEVLNYEFVGIPALPCRFANFQRFLKLTIAVSFPCSKNSSLDEM
ncbi:hypothetical protein AVEN_250501-1 [Araneus ventricosus]|uniref:Uncharacterized protein n=1 Tax=Araneus ventricosus TaxID=182803 RepID=A0A4Y2FI26_ARAVE|nr:hypothetical protein AVEN_250501-1 [Araneus ventricosus]